MKFLADHDVYAVTVAFLVDRGHEVATAASLGLTQAEDTEILRVAREQGRILVTRDRDYGSLVFVQGSGPGVLYLRILPSTLNAVHAELDRILRSYEEEDLRSSFLVVEPGRHRLRKPSPGADPQPG